jgi:hypothetical protein
MIKKLTMIVGGLGVVLVLGYVVTLVAVKPVSMDLSLVGQGKPALVLAYENFSPTGGAALERLRKVRGDYEERLVFVVADLGTPQGQGFANRYGLVDGQAVFLDGAGQPLRATHIPSDLAVLRSQLDIKLAAVE